MGTDHRHGPIRERRGVRYTEVRLGWLWKHEPGTYVKFTPVGAEMFAKADGNLKSLVMQSGRAAALTVSLGYTLVSRCTETLDLSQ